MREILYTFNQRGLYETRDNTAFGDDRQVKIIVEPHEYSLTVGHDVLRRTSCGGYTVIASREGETVFYNDQNEIIGRADKGETCYKNVILEWKQDTLTIQFGQVDEVDYYPNCDGEHDRWGQEWITKRQVTLTLNNMAVEVQ
ncbi:MAG: hypothetical protein IKM39_05245 [Clostridia bacterium]|nr:hypothetical protein [Clostridia bacterium]